MNSLIIFHLAAAVCGLLFCSNACQAQALTVRLSIVSPAESAKVSIEGEYPPGSLVWSFQNTHGRVVGLGDRIQGFSLADANGANVPFRKVGPGEFKAERSATRFSYQMDLAAPSTPADATHVSGLNSQCGYLMLADLLPQLQAAGSRLEFQLPKYWSIASSLQKSPDGWYEVIDPGNAVFIVGRDLREKRERIGATEVAFVSAGEWPFAGERVAEIAAKIIKDHSNHAGFDLKGRVALMLAPFPGSFGAERWSAETRGSNVVLLMGHNSPRATLLAQLSVVLTHELFHLWVPNALSLEGDYDWFFEGFTLYQALRSALRLGFIDFQEYLDTIGRVYDSYLHTIERDRFSLLESSLRRWTVASSLVYDKGMLVAFLYDLRLRRASKNRRSLDDVYHELFRRFPPGARRADGNESIISVLNGLDGDEQFARRYVQGPGSIDLETLLPVYGLRMKNSGPLRRLLVDEATNKEQRDLLGSLGYRKRGS